MNETYISVVIPLYNKEKRILTSVRSVLNQSYPHFEVVIVDDGSTDGSYSVVSQIDDKRVNVIKQPNAGPSGARNNGVKNAKYDWVIFLDADDEMEPDSLEHFVHLIVDNPSINVFVSNFYFDFGTRKKLQSVYYKDGVLKDNFRAWFFHLLMPCQGSTMYRKDVLLKHPYNTHLRRFEDAEMLFDIMREEKIYTSSKPVFSYYQESTTASKPRESINEDFMGHISIVGKGFWENVVLYDFYIDAIELYGDQAKRLYKDLKWEYAVVLTYHGLTLPRRVAGYVKHSLLGL